MCHVPIFDLLESIIFLFKLQYLKNHNNSPIVIISKLSHNPFSIISNIVVTPIICDVQHHEKKNMYKNSVFERKSYNNHICNGMVRNSFFLLFFFLNYLGLTTVIKILTYHLYCHIIFKYKNTNLKHLTKKNIEMGH